MKGIRKLLSSLRFRMLAVYLIVVVTCFVTVLIISERLMERTLLSGDTDARLSELSRISYSLTESVDKNDTAEMYGIIKAYAQSVDGRVLVLDRDYIVIADSSSLYNGYYLPYDEAVQVVNERQTASYGFHKLENSQTGRTEWMSYYAKPLLANGYNKGVVLLAVSVQQVSDTIISVQNHLWGAFGALLVIMTIVVLVLVMRSLNPIVALTNIMRNATAKTFEKRVEIKAQGEVAELVDAFNRMGSELNAHDKIRDQFVADASHELKTPLAAIKVLSESVIYCDDPPPELMLEFLKDIDAQVDRLNNIVQDLLNVARDASMNVEYNMEITDFSDIVSKIVKIIRPVAEKKDLVLNLQEDENIIIFGDKSRMERVVTNLVDNAVKYTEKGSIDVTLKRERREAVLIVKDTGIGIPEESIPRLFIRFYRVDKARSRATGGTGLGLSMVEEIVNRHGGTVSVESKVGVGSEFTVRIPLA